MPQLVELPVGWAFDRRPQRVEALNLLPRRVRTLLAAEWARSVLHLFKDKYPDDLRPLKAIEAAEAWVYSPTEANRTAAAAAASAAYAARAAYAAYAADAAASAAYAARAADAAADAAASAASAAYAADASDAKWRWLYATYCQARGPLGLVFNPEWRTETAVSLARGIVKERAFGRLPILADALQDAGCDHPELMIHLQQDTEEWTSADWVLWNLHDLGTGV